MSNMREKYIQLLDLSNIMRQIDNAGYLDAQEQSSIEEQIKGPFRINCHRLAYSVVKQGVTLEGTISRVSGDIDALYTEMTMKGIEEIDLEDGEYLKQSLNPLIERHWNRSPISRFVLGTLDKHPQLVILPIIAVFLGSIAVASKLGWVG